MPTAPPDEPGPACAQAFFLGFLNPDLGVDDRRASVQTQAMHAGQAYWNAHSDGDRGRSSGVTAIAR